MRFSRKVSLLLVSSCSVLNAVSAIPLKWTLNDIAFATGNFVFDDDTDIFSNINITTSDGSVAGTYYTVLRSSTDNMDLRLYPEGTDVTKDLTRIKVFSLQVPALTNAGRRVDILSVSEAKCADPKCQGLFNPLRVTTTGYVEAPAGTEDPRCGIAFKRCDDDADCCSNRCSFRRCSLIPRVLNVTSPREWCYNLRSIYICRNESGIYYWSE
jgi:hypothetical protein